MSVRRLLGLVLLLTLGGCLGTLEHTARVASGLSASSTWVLDPENRTGCASDENTCTSATCDAATGAGPCATYRGLTRAWGTTTPTVPPQARITVQVLSSWPESDTDDINLTMFGAGYGILSFDGTLGTRAISTGTLSGVRAKNPHANQMLAATLAPRGAAAQTGMRICNETRGSCAWVNDLVSGQWQMTQPLTTGSVTEDDGWADGDAFELLELPTMRLESANVVDSGNSFLVVRNVALPHGLTVALGSGAYFVGSQLWGDVTAAPNAVTVANIVDCDLGSSQFIGQTPPGVPAYQFWAGQSRDYLMQGSFYFTQDFVLAGAGLFQASGINGNVWVTTNPSTVWHVAGGVTYFTGYVAGAGIINPMDSGQVKYVKTAAETFLLHHHTGALDDTLQVDFAPFADAVDRSVDPAVMHPHRALTPAALDTPASTGGFDSIALAPGGAYAYERYGSP